MIDHRGIVISHLSSFRPSDREALNGFLDDPAQQDATLDAIRAFIEEWEEADWLEAYSLERMGKWIGKTQKHQVIDTLNQWAQKKSSEARTALSTGLRTGLAERAFVVS